MRRIFLLLLSLIILQVDLLAQAVEGRIQDKVTGEPLAYVNIGVVGKDVGTVSNQQGNFLLNIDERYNQDTLKISIVGYQSRSFVVADFRKQMQNNPTVTLTEATAMLKEVVVEDKRYRGRKLNEKVLGNTDATDGSQTGFDTNLLGNEMGIIVKVRRKPTFIQDFSINITENQYNSFKFRINFYTVKKGLPDTNILTDNIVVDSQLKEGNLTVDLREYNIVMEDNFFVAMEWIEDLESKSLFFATDISGSASPTIVRKTSQGDWKEVGKAAFGTGIGITLTVLQ